MRLSEDFLEMCVVKEGITHRLDKMRALRSRTILITVHKMLYVTAEGIHTHQYSARKKSGKRANMVCCLYNTVHMGIFSFSRNIGIDMGTSQTRLYMPYRGITFDEPSIVALDKKEMVCIGSNAKEMMERANQRAEARHIIIYGAIQDEKMVEQYLRKVFKQSNGILKFIRRDALVGVPTNATNMQQRSAMQTCGRAGMRRVFTEKNAILAALGVGMHKDELHGRMISDIGAGLTETAVISLGGASSSSTVQVGGNDMDTSIVSYIERHHQLLISKGTARRIKEKIGSAMQLTNPKEIKVKGGDARNKLPRIVRVTSNDIADAIRGEVKMILDAIASVFQSTPPELTSDIIDRGLILTGGVAKLHGLDVEISKHINVPVQVADEPEHAVIRGIGRSMQSGHLDFHKWVIQSK